MRNPGLNKQVSAPSKLTLTGLLMVVKLNQVPSRVSTRSTPRFQHTRGSVSLFQQLAPLIKASAWWSAQLHHCVLTHQPPLTWKLLLSLRGHLIQSQVQPSRWFITQHGVSISLKPSTLGEPTPKANTYCYSTTTPQSKTLTPLSACSNSPRSLKLQLPVRNSPIPMSGCNTWA